MVPLIFCFCEKTGFRLELSHNKKITLFVEDVLIFVQNYDIVDINCCFARFAKRGKSRMRYLLRHLMLSQSPRYRSFDRHLEQGFL